MLKNLLTDFRASLEKLKAEMAKKHKKQVSGENGEVEGEGEAKTESSGSDKKGFKRKSFSGNKNSNSHFKKFKSNTE